MRDNVMRDNVALEHLAPGASLRSSLIILSSILLLFAPAVLEPDGLIYPAQGQFTDLTITHWPAFQYLRDALHAAGSIPLWRTSILGGTPFAADSVSGVWYPPNWFSIVLPLEWFFKLLIVAHLFLGGWATMQLARSFGARGIGATAAGLAYAIAPRAIGHVGAGHVTLVEAWAWLPVTVWAARQASRRGDLAAGVALGVCALADLRLAVYAGLALTSSVLIGEGSSRFKGTRLALILLVAAWVSAATWLPALALAAESTRASLAPSEAAEFSLPVGSLAGLLLAGRGDPERLTYVGLTVLVLALIGVRSVWHTRRRVALWLIALIVLGVIVALGMNTPLYEVLYRIPGVALLRAPGRAWFLVVFAAALACGLGLDAALRWTAGRRLEKKWLLAGWIVGCVAVLFGAGGALVAFAGGPGAERAGLSLVGLAIFLPATIGLVIARARGRLAPRHFAALMLPLIALDLLWAGWGQYRVVGREAAFADGRALAEYVRSAVGGDSRRRPSGDASASGDASYRMYSPSYSVPQHVAQAQGLELVDGIDPLQLARTVRFMQRASGVGAWGYSVTLPAFEGLTRDEALRTWLAEIVPDPMLLGLLNVKYVAAHFPIAHSDLAEVARLDGAFVYENRRARPRAWVVGRVAVVSDQAQALDWLTAHDVREEAVVEGGRALDLNTAASEAQVALREPDRLVVSARGPGLLVLSEVYERDWRAWIDGAPASIVPANGVLRGVYLNEGLHRVELVYDPVIVKVGVAVSGIGLGGWIVSWLVGWLAGWRVRRRLAA
ncbi:MAG TPA: hypothetical protein VJG32_20125 [Anaerolineae bacterium]|nr:hypothetical protein [Anaerolineae bacterium]